MRKIQNTKNIFWVWGLLLGLGLTVSQNTVSAPKPNSNTKTTTNNNTERWFPDKTVLNAAMTGSLKTKIKRVSAADLQGFWVFVSENPNESVFNALQLKPSSLGRSFTWVSLNQQQNELGLRQSFEWQFDENKQILSEKMVSVESSEDHSAWQTLFEELGNTRPFAVEMWQFSEKPNQKQFIKNPEPTVILKLRSDTETAIFVKQDGANWQNMFREKQQIQ